MEKTWKDIGKDAGLVIGAAIAGMLITWGSIKYVTKDNLTPNDFKKVRWVESYNSDGKLWDDYMKAKIPHNTYNWSLYLNKIREKNRGELEGTILLPDFEKTKERKK